MTTAEKHVDDNWGKLYQAILNFNEPLSIVCNALKFREDIPELTRSSGGALTPPLSDCYDFSSVYAYDTICDSYRTFGLMTPSCLPLAWSFLMAVAFYVRVLTQP